ncbi:unnamed protein product [Brachionus calyciflorus]|uniref:Uncharacterized protein n=1 Tax=Brachionus calyciflorus TaxID=104777 RepID=A0A813M9I4_9BILA|nr:unnamed protein product [Brachionus calyciflorus]
MSKLEIDWDSNESIDYVSDVEIYKNRIHSRIASKTSYSFDDKSDYFENKNDYSSNSSLEETQGKLIISPETKLNKNDLNKIYKKLNNIHSKLINEYKILQQREKTITERELKLQSENGSILENLKIKYDEEIENIKDQIKKKSCENKRLSDSFRVCKESNESLKSKLAETQDKLDKLDKQNHSLKNRLSNLHKKIEISENKTQNFTENPKVEIIQPKKSLNSTQSLNLFEPFAASVSWINETFLKQKLDFSLPLNNDVNLIEKIQKILPTLSDLLINSKKQFKEYQKTFLEFIYWSLLHFDSSFQNQKLNLSNTFRRIGEELFKNIHSSKTDEAFSVEWLDLQDTKSRLLSYMIILRTLNQIDYIIQIFELLKDELKEEGQKETFLGYHGTWTILKWCKLGNQIVLNLSTEVYLIMSVEWTKQSQFLNSCSNEYWFSQMSILLRNSNVTTCDAFSSSSSISLANSQNSLDLRIIEKMSILYQKLSKNPQNKKYFDMFSLTKICNDLLKRFGHESEFLKMNLKSILFNLK